MMRLTSFSTLFPYTTLFRSVIAASFLVLYSVIRFVVENYRMPDVMMGFDAFDLTRGQWLSIKIGRAHVELQSRRDLVCRLLLEKKKREKRRRRELTLLKSIS